MLSWLDIRAHNLSNPNAIPPCGGAPYSNAFNKNPNWDDASFSEKPRQVKTFLEEFYRILIDPH